MNSILGSRRSPAEGNGNPLQYSCLGNPMNRGNLVGYSPWGHKRVGHNLVTKQQNQKYTKQKLTFPWGSLRFPKVLQISSCCCCSVTQSYSTLCNPMDCSTPGLPVPHHLPEFAQVHVHCISDAIQPSHPPTPSPPSALNLSQHQGLLQWLSCLHQMTKILEFQLQHQSFQWVFRVDFP